MKFFSLKGGIFFILSFLIFSYSINFASASELSYQLRGSFLLQAEGDGEAWYVDKKNGLKHYLPNNGSAIFALSKLGIGISNANLAKIPIAVDARLVEKDSDGDELDDRLEVAIGTDPFNPDSDGDSFPDGLEIKNNYNPLGSGRLPIDLVFSARLAGEILLQVEGSGEAWYVHPQNKQRYYLPDDLALFKVIKYFGRGVSNYNLEQIADSRLIKGEMKKNIKIDVSKEHRLYYYLDDVLLGSFPVSAGKARTPTPKGEFKIINKHPKAWSPFGLWMPYWLGLGTGRFGIHELPIWPNGYREGESHLGVPVSHGCIRLGIGRAEFLYNWVDVGTPVFIY